MDDATGCFEIEITQYKSQGSSFHFWGASPFRRLPRSVWLSRPESQYLDGKMVELVGSTNEHFWKLTLWYFMVLRKTENKFQDKIKHQYNSSTSSENWDDSYEWVPLTCHPERTCANLKIKKTAFLDFNSSQELTIVWWSETPEWKSFGCFWTSVTCINAAMPSGQKHIEDDPQGPTICTWHRRQRRS